MKRRELIQSLAMAAAGTMLPATAVNAKHDPSQENDTVFEDVQEVAAGVFFIKGETTFFSNGDVRDVACNNGWIIFKDFVLVIDSNFPGNAPLLLRAIRKHTALPVRFVFNTHHHGDHLYGNSFWVQQGATPIAYKGLIDELRKYETGYYGNTPGRWETMQQKREDVRRASLYPPTITFEQKLIVGDKDRQVELIHLGAGHTLGDAVAWLPKEKIMFVGDACQNGPYNLFMDAHVQSWVNTLEVMKMYNPAMVFVGHGDPGDGAIIGRQLLYFKKLLAWMKDEIGAGNDWQHIRPRLSLLRDEIRNDASARRYLIDESSPAPGFSLEAHAEKIFKELTA